MSWVTVAVTGVSALNSISQGHTAKAQGALQQQADNYAAGVEEQSALETARIIRKAGARTVSAQTAAYAGAGVKVGEGSAAEVERQTNLDVEHDAFQALLEGSRRARGLRTQGAFAMGQGNAAQTAGYLNAATTVLAGGYGVLKSSGWRANGPGYSGGQEPAPVVNRDFPRG